MRVVGNALIFPNLLPLDLLVFGIGDPFSPLLSAYAGSAIEIVSSFEPSATAVLSGVAAAFLVTL